MGRVLAPYGVKGWIRVAPHTVAAGALGAYPSWWLGRRGEWSEIVLAESKVHGATLLARFAGVADRDAAAKLRGCEVAVPRSSLAPAGRDEYYWADLIGLEVVNGEGAALGKVSGLFSNGAHDVLRVGRGKDERLVPFVAAVLRKVDLAAGRIEVDWGLDW